MKRQTFQTQLGSFFNSKEPTKYEILSVKPGRPDKGGLMSEGILTLVPVPTKNDKSLDSATINFEFPTLNSKQLIQILCSESDFLAMGLKSKYLLRLSHLKSTRLNLVMLGQKKILASYFLPLLSMHLVLNFPNFPV